LRCWGLCEPEPSCSILPATNNAARPPDAKPIKGKNGNGKGDKPLHEELQEEEEEADGEEAAAATAKAK
jgi:hypothetical protein